MATRYISKDIYDMADSITAYKGDYDAAKARGDDAAAEAAHNAADDIRKRLASYGYSDIVDDMAHKDYAGAKATLSNYAVYGTAPATSSGNGGISSGTGVLQGAYSVGGGAKTAAKQRAAASAEYDRRAAAGQDASGIATATKDYIVTDMSAQDRAVTDHMDAGGKQRYIDAVYTDTPAEAYDRNVKAMRDEGKTSMDYYRQMYDPSYGQHIRDYYNVYGQAAGTQAGMSGAADNGGNLDSYGQYNRAVTDLSYRNAAQRAIQAERDGYAQGWATMYTPWASSLNQGATAYGGYVNDANKLIADYDVALQQIASGERQANVAAELQRYGYDAETAAKMAASEAAQAQSELEYYLELEKIKRDYGVAQIDADAKVQTAQIDAGAKTASAQISAAKGSGSTGSTATTTSKLAAAGGTKSTTNQSATTQSVSALDDIMQSLFGAGAKSANDAYATLRDAGVSQGDSERYAKEYDSYYGKHVNYLNKYISDINYQFSEGKLSTDGVISLVENDSMLSDADRTYIYNRLGAKQ